jgi:hypothetical protein
MHLWLVNINILFYRIESSFIVNTLLIEHVHLFVTFLIRMKVEPATIFCNATISHNLHLLSINSKLGWNIDSVSLLLLRTNDLISYFATFFVPHITDIKNLMYIICLTLYNRIHLCQPSISTSQATCSLPYLLQS